MLRFNKAVFLLTIFLISFLFVVWVRVKFVRTGYQKAELKNQERRLQVELAYLEYRLAQIKSPASVAALARQAGYEVAGDYAAPRVRHLKRLE